MKVPGRILIILAVFALVMGITYTAVNAVEHPGLGRRPGLNQGMKDFLHPREHGQVYPKG